MVAEYLYPVGDSAGGRGGEKLVKKPKETKKSPKEDDFQKKYRYWWAFHLKFRPPEEERNLGTKIQGRLSFFLGGGGHEPFRYFWVMHTHVH